MSDHELVNATSGGMQETFSLCWDHQRWTSAKQNDMADFPFIAQVRGKRYELYGDGTFDEEELAAGSP